MHIWIKCILIVPKEEVFLKNYNITKWYTGSTVSWAYKRSNFAYTSILPSIKVLQKMNTSNSTWI